MEKGEKQSYSQRDINQEENEHKKLMAHEPVPPGVLEEGANTSSHVRNSNVIITGSVNEVKCQKCFL